MRRLAAIAVIAWSAACGGAPPQVSSALPSDAPAVETTTVETTTVETTTVETAAPSEREAATPAPSAVPPEPESATHDVVEVADEPAADAAADADGDTHDEDIESARLASLRRRGRAVYDRHCESCHDEGPRLLGRGFAPGRVRRQVRRGSARMRAIPPARLSEADLEAVCALLSAR